MAFVLYPSVNLRPTRKQPITLHKTVAYDCLRRARSPVIGCVSRTTDDDNLRSVRHDLTAVSESSPSVPPTSPRPKSLDELEDSGMKNVKQAADELKTELELVNERLEKFADEETAKVLDKYDEANRELLEAQRERIEEIKRDASYIKNLTDTIRSTRSQTATTPKLKLLNVLAFFFALGALSYGYSGITESNALHLRYGTLDALIAAVCASWVTYSGSDESDVESS